jgi:hypothetical protein
MLSWIDIQNNNHDYFLKYTKKDTSMQPLEAAYYTIDYIHQNYPPPYTLMLSGGVDSQAMLYAWHTSGKSYNTFSGVYNNSFNENDLCTLRSFAHKHNIFINFVDFDLLSFLQNEHIQYVEQYRCGSPHMTAFMKMSEMIIDGTVIMAGNFWSTSTPEVNIISKNNFSLFRYAKTNKKPLVPFFFCETQDLAFSFKTGRNLTDDETKYYISIDPTQLLFTYKQKVNLYQTNGFPVIEQDKKLTGFELVKDYYDVHYAHLVTTKDRLTRYPRQTSQRVFDLLLRNKYEAKFYHDKYISTLVS